jgi:hypothetical protein
VSLGVTTLIVILCTVTLANRDEQHIYLMTTNLRGTRSQLVFVSTDFVYAADYFADESIDTFTYKKTFEDVGQIEEYWEWLRGPFMKNLFPDSKLEATGGNNTNNSTNQPLTNSGFVLLYNKIVGAVQIRYPLPANVTNSFVIALNHIRQLRVKASRCTQVRRNISGFISKCFPPYSYSNEEKNEFVTKNNIT